MVASANGMESCVGWLLKKLRKVYRAEEAAQLRMELNRIDREGLSPLYYAVSGNHEKTALLLLEQGASVQGLNQTIPPLLFVAIDRGNAKLVDSLLRNGSSVNELYEGQTALASSIAHCGIRVTSDIASSQEKEERRIIFDILLNHAQLSKELNFDELMGLASYYNLAHVLQNLEAKKNANLAEKK